MCLFEESVECCKSQVCIGGMYIATFCVCSATSLGRFCHFAIVCTDVSDLETGSRYGN